VTKVWLRNVQTVEQGGTPSGARRVRVALTAAALALALGGAQMATAFLQLPDGPSPESGTAQVVAQGVAGIGDGELRWVVEQRTAPPPANAADAVSNLGFLVVDAGVLLVEDTGSGAQARLPAGEAVLTTAGTEQTRAALGAENAVYYELALTEAGSAPAQALFGSEPFAGPGTRHDLDLLQDVLGPGAQVTIPAGALPTLVLATAGVAQVATEAGDVVSLGAGQAIALSGALVVTGAENGAAISAVYVGPAAPRLAQAAATPEVRTIAGAEEAATPAAIVAEPDAAAETDEDGDGLSAARETEVGTDAALADSDEDGLSDGDEVDSVGTDPLNPDSDGDGVLDGDEVLQGTNPRDDAPVVAEPETDAGVVIEGGVASETEAPAPAPANPLDADGDGLEDAIEFELGTDPADTDTDDDGASDGDEYYVHATGTRNPDTDADGVLDGDEVANGTNPNDPGSF
jgi:hypothetical protein